MRKHRRVVLPVKVILMVAPVLVGCGDANVKNRAEERKTNQEKVMTESAVNDEISFTVDLPKHVKLEGPIHAELRLQNRSKSVIIIDPPKDPAHELRQIHIEIKDENGERVERTALGNDALMQSELLASGPSDRMAPSQHRVWKLDLEQFFQLKRGKYTLIASVVILKIQGGESNGQSIESKPVHFTVN